MVAAYATVSDVVAVGSGAGLAEAGAVPGCEASAPAATPGLPLPARAWRLRLGALLLGLAGCCATASSWRRAWTPAGLVLLRRGARLDLKEELYCGPIEEDSEYRGTPLPGQLRARTVEDCCGKCQEEPRCRAWTYAEESRNCSLLGLRPGERAEKVDRSGYKSGLSFNLGNEASLFCFALMLPYSYEQGLLVMQHKVRTSIFACDEYAVYSNMSIQLAPGVRTSIVDSNLVCKKGGEFKTALNLQIFIQVWKKVAIDGRYLFHGWTVKADPDSVFFPQRLRVAVQFHRDEYDGLYLNNCKFGMHGPLEVLSQAAVRAWLTGVQRCVKHFFELCSGDCKWGEDMFLDQCLGKFLKVRRIDDANLLSEEHCESEDWQDCRNGRVSFHPFKDTAEYAACLQRANFGSLPEQMQV